MGLQIAGSSIHRRSDLGVLQIQFRALDRRAIGRHRRLQARRSRVCVIMLLARADLFLEQERKALLVDARLLRVGLVAREVGLGLRERSGKRPRIDHKE